MTTFMIKIVPLFFPLSFPLLKRSLYRAHLLAKAKESEGS